MRSVNPSDGELSGKLTAAQFPMPLAPRYPGLCRRACQDLADQAGPPIDISYQPQLFSTAGARTQIAWVHQRGPSWLVDNGEVMGAVGPADHDGIASKSVARPRFLGLVGGILHDLRHC